MKPIEQELFDRWMAVFNAANDGDDLRKPTAFFTGLYKKADYQQQGEFHHRVHAFMKS